LKKFIFILVFSGLKLFSNAQPDYLQPEKGLFSGYTFLDEYYSVVKKVLFDSLSLHTDLRIIVMASFSPEYLISLDTKESKTYLTYRIVKQQIWQIPKPNDQVKFNNYKIEFDPSITKKIHELFVLAISKSKFDCFTDGIDGTTYIFTTYENGYGLIGGQTWSPRTEKLTGLVAIAEWLNDCARTGATRNLRPSNIIHSKNPKYEEFDCYIRRCKLFNN
jgi:hypothetical protein